MQKGISALKFFQSRSIQDSLFCDSYIVEKELEPDTDHEINWPLHGFEFFCNITNRNFLFVLVREQLKDLSKEYDKSENDLKALQSVGQVWL